MSWLTYALLVFLVGACGGLVLASFVLRGRFAPWAVSLLHALLGATGIALLVVAVMMDSLVALPLVALGLFLITAMLGFFLASLHFDQKVAMKKYVLTHASFAVTSVIVLLIAVLRS